MVTVAVRSGDLGSFLISLFPPSFYDRRDAEDAMHSMDGRMMDGRELRVQLARYGRPDDPPSRRHGHSRSSRRRRYFES